MSRINWKEEFDKVDMENGELYRRLKNEQIKRLLVEQIMKCEDADRLERISCFVGASLGLRLVDSGLSNIHWIERDKAV